MKHILLTTIGALVLVGCGESQPKQPDISIHKAARKGNIEFVKQHIAAGTDVNAKSEGFSTPLHQAAQFGRKEIAELLIIAGADVNASKIGRSTRGNNVKEINNGITPLHLAAFGRHKETAQLLIAKGADVNAKSARGHTPVDRARAVNAFHSPKREKEIITLLLKHGGKSGASDSIHVAADLGNIEAVKQHLAAGADVDAKFEDNQSTRFWGLAGRTPLRIAASKGQKEVVELLLGSGANVKAKDDSYKTPLDYAIENKQTETTRLLRKNGAKTGSELPPVSLFEALNRDDLQAVKDLLAKGANVNAKNIVGWTPLHDAAIGGEKEVVELLIAKGANVNAKMDDGRTPLDAAIYGKKPQTADLLRKHGGKTGEELKAEQK